MNILGIFAGLFIIGLFQYSEQFNSGRFEFQKNDEKVSSEMVRVTINKYICQQQEILPKGVVLPFELPDIVYLCIGICSMVLLIICSRIKRTGIIQTMMIFLITGILFFISMFGFIFYLNMTSNPIVCGPIKNFILPTIQVFGDSSILQRITIQDLPIYQLLIHYYPQSQNYLSLFIKKASVIGLNSPVLLMTIGFFLLSKKSMKTTRTTVVSLVTAIVVMMTSIDYIKETQDTLSCVICSVIVIIMVLIIFNSMVSSGHFLLLPIILVNCCSVVIGMYRVFVIEVFILFMIVYVFSLLYIYFWSDGYAVIASSLVFLGMSQIIPLRSGYLLATIFLLTGFKN
ncbi:hypothetical protein ENUP19_0132G0010 [Entamoeba nuttalli]|uniref:Uncharacterized protein n=2 Tax=Entamoeba nuttalli TaxID=412467 RepID=K2GUM8_ENTNP|nr:hypothetical protein ENU1_152920 [Entamoeba nuttalli P19]EKE38803.1 hypothetical protein ENU1_152920 [Entamoeba nuttalli P19]|eukprot:XP_008858864.1 hypothetical protein ENU1_152920 [Entamoeba nuttalli P19]